MSKNRVVVIVNKWWECDPILSVLLNDTVRPGQFLGEPQWVQTPRRRPDQARLPAENPAPIPRAVFALRNAEVELWCVSDLLEHLPNLPKFQPSSERKAEQLPKIFKNRQADMVLAVGTAAFPDKVKTHNGDVIVGTNVFLHNGHPSGENPDSNWQKGPFDRVLRSVMDASDFTRIVTFDAAMTPKVSDRFLVPPLNPANGTVVADCGLVALGSLNVTDSSEYDAADQRTLDAYDAVADPANASSIETTHGLIRVQSDAPFMFVSGIVNRFTFFGAEVLPRSYSQNTAAATNAGIAVAWMLPNIDSVLGGG